MSDVSEHSDSKFYFPKKEKKKKEKRGGHMIKCLLTELDWAKRENIWPSVMAHRPRCAQSIRHDVRPNIFPSGPPTQSISTYFKNKSKGFIGVSTPKKIDECTRLVKGPALSLIIVVIIFIIIILFCCCYCYYYFKIIVILLLFNFF